MKSDVLDSFPIVKACIGYKVNGEVINHVPYDITGVEPIYKDFPGWQTDITKIRREEELPTKFMNYLKVIEEFLGVPVKIISVGPDREQTIVR